MDQEVILRELELVRTELQLARSWLEKAGFSTRYEVVKNVEAALGRVKRVVDDIDPKLPALS